MATSLRLHDKIAVLNYYAGCQIGEPSPINALRPKTVYAGCGNYQEVVIRNLREYPEVLEKLSIDVHGFELHRWPSVEKTFDDQKRVTRVYHEECIELLKKLFGAYYVEIDTNLIRNQPFEKVLENIEKDGTPEALAPPRAPARHVHSDVSTREGPELARQSLERLPEELREDLRGRRFAVMNIWRPLNLVLRDPLAVADAFSFDDEEFTPVQYSFVKGVNNPKFVRSELFMVTPKDASKHRWYYVYKMEPDEVLVFKQYDSQPGVAARAPHTSFVDEEFEGRGLPPRGSIEIRARVWF